jgi:phosphoribosyl-dephospho-CoA transferase
MSRSAFVNSPFRPDKHLGRHDLVFVKRGSWRALLEMREDLAVDPLVARWSEEGWPTIRRRAMPHELAGVPLGIPLPPSAGKRRLSILLQSHHIGAIARPPLLSSASKSAPRAWWPTLGRLDKLAFRYAVDARVFGSLAWQTVTGLAYLSHRSDVDVLLDVRCDTDLDGLAAGLAEIEAAAPMRLDGELMREDRAAVNWRELHTGAGEVLVKSVDGVALLRRDLFVAGRTMR